MASRKKIPAPTTPALIRMFATDAVAGKALKMYFAKTVPERERFGIDRWLEGYLQATVESHYVNLGRRLHWNRGKMIKQLRVLTGHVKRKMLEMTAPREC